MMQAKHASMDSEPGANLNCRLSSSHTARFFFYCDTLMLYSFESKSPSFHIMAWLKAKYWLLFFIAKLVVAPPQALHPDFEFHPACYDTDRECFQIIPVPLCVMYFNTCRKPAPIVQQNLGNITCSAKCLLGAANVQILLWPTETNENNMDNTPTTIASTASGIVSNGVTL